MCRFLLALFVVSNSTHNPGGITNASTGYRVSKGEHSVTISCGTLPTCRKAMEAVLSRCAASIIEDWLARAKKITEISDLLLSDAERTGHLAKLLDDLVIRLQASPTVEAVPSASAVAHGEMRCRQGYTPPMMVDDHGYCRSPFLGH
jgi:hypothetical protein